MKKHTLNLVMVLLCFAMVFQAGGFLAMAAEPPQTDSVATTSESGGSGQQESSGTSEAELPAAGTNTGETAAGNNEEQPQEPGDVPPQDALPANGPVNGPTTPFADGNNIKDYFAPGETASIVTGGGIIFKDENGQVLDPSNLPQNAFFTINIDFAIPEDVRAQIQNGDYYDIAMPPGLNLPYEGGTQYPIVANGEEVAAYYVTETGGIRIVFNEKTQTASNIHGGFTVSGELNGEDLGGPGNIVIEIPEEDEFEGVPIVVKPNTDVAVEKDGQPDKAFNPDNITWTVDANKQYDTHDNLVINEYLPEGLTLTSVKVYETKVDFDGNVIQEVRELSISEDYTVDSDGNVTFSNTVNYPVRIVYTTEIDPAYKPGTSGGTVEFINEVGLQSTQQPEEIMASSETETNYLGRLEKEEVSYNSNTQIASWRVRYNYDESSISAPISLTDTLPAGFAYVPGSMKIYKVIINADGTSTQTELMPGDFFEVTENNGQLIITLKEDIDFAIDIEYDTKVTSIIDDKETFTNKVEDGDGNESEGSATISSGGLKKTVTSIDKDTNIVHWKIVVNKEGHEINKWKLTDTFPNQSFNMDLLIYPQGSPGAPFTEGLDYSLTVQGNSFVVEMLPSSDYYPFTETLVLEFSTTCDLTGGETSFKNKANATWTDSQGGNHENNSNATATFTPEEGKNGTKGGSYNAQTKEITWFIRVNSSHLGLQNASIEDKMLDGLVFVPGSTRIYHFTKSNSGDITKGELLTPAELAAFTITEPQNNTSKPNTLEILLPDGGADAMYWIEYETSFENEVIGQNVYNNEAIFNNSIGPNLDLTASVTVAHGGELIGKQGQKENDGYVWWTVTVNPSQSTLRDVLVRDIHDQSQVVDLSSVVIYGTTVDQNGNLAIDEGNTLAEDAYTVTYFLNEDENWEMDIHFDIEITRAYVIRYRVKVLSDGNDPSITLTNKVYITDLKQTDVTGSEEGSTTVTVGSGGGWVTGTLGFFQVRKVNGETTEALEGAEFQLYFDEALSDPFGGVARTDETGLITYLKIPYGTYWLKEEKVPAGYSFMSPNPKKIVIDAANSGAVFEIENIPSVFELEKQDFKTGAFLPGAEFSLYMRNEANQWNRILADQTLITDADGKLEIKGLVPGEYYLMETAAPGGYKPDYETRYPFTMVYDDAGSLVAQYDFENPVTNEPTVVNVIKYNQDGSERLQGAVFVLEKYNEETGQWEQLNVGSFYTTDENGEITIEGLSVGRYRLTEVAAPIGYVRSHPQEFEVKITGTGLQATIEDITLEFYNYPAQAHLHKVDSETGASLAGAEFALYKKADETGEYQRVRTAESFITDENGMLDILNLQVNSEYYLQEITAPECYVLSDEKIYFSTESNEIGHIVVSDLGEIGNTPRRVEMVKVSSTQSSPLAGAVFTLEMQQADGSWVQAGEPAGYTSGQDGKITMTGLLNGQYRVFESTPPQGYLISSRIVEFAVSQDSPELIDLGNYANDPESTGGSTSDPHSPKTGDRFNILLWAGLGAVALAGVVVLIILQKRRNKNDKNSK